MATKKEQTAEADQKGKAKASPEALATREHQITDIELEFLTHLKTYPLENAERIVSYITSQGERVLEDPEKFVKAISECEISPVAGMHV